MSVVFYLLGWLFMIAGGGWTAMTVNHNLNMERAGIEGLWLAVIPGVAALMAGLILLAIAGILRRLDRLISLTRKSVHAETPSSARSTAPSNARRDWD